jgi:hypothetical protein
MTGSFHVQGQLSIETRLESQALAGYACQVSTFDAPFSMIGSLIRPATGGTCPGSQNNLPWLSKIILTSAISNSRSCFIINSSQSFY